MSTTLTELASSSIGGLSLRAEPLAASNLSDLETKGVSLGLKKLWAPTADLSKYSVVSGVLSKDQAQHYVDELYEWLESFGMGFKSDDRSTWHVGNVPQFEK
jgi:hypothetical protein